MDVDSYCANKRTAALYASGKKYWSGALSRNPVSLRSRYGSRWLSTEFKAGDVLIFSMFTIHASLDNHSSAIRLSTDSRYQLASEPVDERWVGSNPIGHSLAGRRSRICWVNACENDEVGTASHFAKLGVSSSVWIWQQSAKDNVVPTTTLTSPSTGHSLLGSCLFSDRLSMIIWDDLWAVSSGVNLGKFSTKKEDLSWIENPCEDNH